MTKTVENKLHSQEVERACLSAAIRFPERLIDVLTIIGEDHFNFEAHKLIFHALRGTIQDNQKVDSLLLTDKIKTLGLSNIEGVDIADYIKSLKNLNGINEDAFLEYYTNLHKYYNARELFKVGKRIQKFVEANLDKKSSEMIAGVEKIFGEKINTYQRDNEPVDLFKDLKDDIEAAGNEPKEDGIMNPYKNFREFYGNFLLGALYIFCAPFKNGKSTLLLDIARKVSAPGKIKVLYLDTELSTKAVKYRLASSLSGVNEYYIRTGKYRLDKNMTESVRKIWSTVEEMIGSIDHLYVAGKPIDEIISMVRRWKFKNISKGMTPLVIYDYIKLTGEKVTEFWKEHQVIGEKADKLKQLAQEIGGPIIAAMQTNAQNEISMSKQIAWFCDQCCIFRKKDVDEIQKEGPDFGTHKLKMVASRQQGEKAMGFDDIVKMPDGSYEQFYFNFKFENFTLEEKGTVLDVATALESGRIDIDDHSDPHANDGNTDF
jgi:replicative DNA helicase